MARIKNSDALFTRSPKYWIVQGFYLGRITHVAGESTRSTINRFWEVMGTESSFIAFRWSYTSVYGNEMVAHEQLTHHSEAYEKMIESNRWFLQKTVSKNEEAITKKDACFYLDGGHYLSLMIMAYFEWVFKGYWLALNDLGKSKEYTVSQFKKVSYLYRFLENPLPTKEDFEYWISQCERYKKMGVVKPK